MDDQTRAQLQSQIDHLRGFQTAMAEQISHLGQRVEALQERRALGVCDTAGCQSPGQIEVNGSVELDALEGLPGPLMLHIHSLLCPQCWRIFALAQGETPLPPMAQSAPLTPPSRAVATWGTPPRRDP